MLSLITNDSFEAGWSFTKSTLLWMYSSFAHLNISILWIPRDCKRRVSSAGKWDKPTGETRLFAPSWWEKHSDGGNHEKNRALWSGSQQENIYAPIITYSCLASHDKRQEAQQLKGGEEISSFHEDQIVWNQTWFIFRGDVKMFEQRTIPQSDDSFLRHKVPPRSRLERQMDSFSSKLKKGCSLFSYVINIFV